MGTSRMLMVYCVSAVTSNLFSYKFNPAPSVGASGAIMGLLGANGVYCFRHKDRLRNGDRILNEIVGYVLLLPTIMHMTCICTSQVCLGLILFIWQGNLTKLPIWHHCETRGQLGAFWWLGWGSSCCMSGTQLSD